MAAAAAVSGPVLLANHLGAAVVTISLRELISDIRATPAFANVRIDEFALAEAYLRAHPLSAGNRVAGYKQTRGRSRLVDKQAAAKWLTAKAASGGFTLQDGERGKMSSYGKRVQEIKDLTRDLQSRSTALRNAEDDLAELTNYVDDVEAKREEQRAELKRLRRRHKELVAELADVAELLFSDADADEVVAGLQALTLRSPSKELASAAAAAADGSAAAAAGAAIQAAGLGKAKADGDTRAVPADKAKAT